MKHVISQLLLSLRLIAMLALMSCMSAQADEYSDVSQLVRANKLSEALARADQYLSTQPKDPQMRFIKGVILRDSGKINEAIAIFTKLTEDYPELPEPYNNLAVLYAGQSQFDKARSALESAIRTNPSYATAHENLGDIYAKLASQAYNKALQLDNANQAVPPKLALIREIFTSGVAKAHSTASGAASNSTPPQNVAIANPPPKPPATVVATPVVTPPVVPPAIKPPPATTPPPVPTVAVTPPTPPVVQAQNTTPGDSTTTADVEAAVAAWARAWSARDVKAYLAAYGKDFDPPGAMSRKSWEEERQQRISSKASISVKIDKLSVSVNGAHAAAKFLQDYKAGGLAVSSRKTLDFTKFGDRWQIVKETVGN